MRNQHIKIFGTLLLFLTTQWVISQQYYRISADFSIKTKNNDTSQQLVMGTVYFDKLNGKLVYDNFFPERETWVIQDTNLYKFKEGVFQSREHSPFPVETSVFSLLLNGSIVNFGLEDSFFTLQDVEVDEGLLISTWIPPDHLAESFGKILISNIGGTLDGIIFFNPEEEILSKQFFREYVNIEGIDFPGEVIQISYINGEEAYQVITYKNVVIDEKDHESFYDFPVDGP